MSEQTEGLPEGFTIPQEEQIQEKELEKSVSFQFVNTFDQEVAEKTETAPGDGEIARIGDELTYQITGRNYKDRTGTLVIRDALDPGVALKEEGTTPGWTVSEAEGKTVLTWTFENVPSGEAREVQLHVTVTDKARETGETQVENQAEVRVGNDSWFKTETVENPLAEEPEKTELTPGEGETVNPGDVITYRVEGTNYYKEPASMVIRDTLDPNVTLEEDGTSPGYETGTNSQGRTVLTWNYDKVQSGEERVVFVAVRVKDEASAEKVVNVASVQVGNDPAVDTRPVENPLEPKETETETEVTTETETETEVTTETETETETEAKKKPPVKTGDETPLYTWIILAMGSAAVLAALAGTVLYRRRKNRKG